MYPNNSFIGPAAKGHVLAMLRMSGARFVMRSPGLLLFVVMLMATTNAYCQRSSAGEMCFAGAVGQADARACLQARLAASEQALADAEVAALAAILRRDEEARFLRRSASAFDASSKLFRRYRTRQCELQASLAAGGSGTDHRRMLCALELNEQRIAHLQALPSSLP